MPHRRQSRSRLHVAALIAAVASSGCISPQALAGLQEQLVEAADAVNNIQVNMSVMQSTIDSLAVVVAKQDTTIARLANAAGIPVVR